MWLDVNVKTRTPLIGDDRLIQIEEILRELATGFLGEKLLVTVDEKVPIDARQEVDLSSRRWLVQCIRDEIARSNVGVKQWAEYFARQSPDAPKYTRPFKNAQLYLVSADGTKEVFLDADDRQLLKRANATHFANSLAIRWATQLRINQLAEACVSIAISLLSANLFEYGRFSLNDEFDAKNLDRSGGGVRAVGLDISKYLPGFYWGNFFGEFLCEVIGKERLLKVPGCNSRSIGKGVFIYNQLPPDTWSQPGFIANAKAATSHIGQRFFFEKGKRKASHLFPSGL